MHSPSTEPFVTPRNVVLVGDATTHLAQLADASVDCVVTSPPYFQLRDYGVTGQAGAEDSITDWVSGLRRVLSEAARVMVPTGTLWLNLGDSFAAHPRQGGARKSLLLGPERMVIALAADGWIVRNKVIWGKTNPLPTSVRDRLSLTYEIIYLLVRRPDYFFDLDAVREPHRSRPVRRPSERPAAEPWRGRLAMSRHGLASVRADGRVGHPLGKNPGDLWRTATSRYAGAHFATFPPELIRRPIVAGCPERVCTGCGKPWRRDPATAHIQPACGCGSPFRPGLVLDPFMGSGTVGVVAKQLGRDWLGIELNPTFATLARDRIAQAGKSDATA